MGFWGIASYISLIVMIVGYFLVKKWGDRTNKTNETNDYRNMENSQNAT